ncbi:MAG: hypothetical protein ACLSCQ_07290 [Evtepia gabavorous]
MKRIHVKGNTWVLEGPQLVGSSTRSTEHLPAAGPRQHQAPGGD